MAPGDRAFFRQLIRRQAEGVGGEAVAFGISYPISIEFIWAQQVRGPVVEAVDEIRNLKCYCLHMMESTTYHVLRA